MKADPSLAVLLQAMVSFLDGLPARDQRIADATVNALADAGYLRAEPDAAKAVVKRVIRDERGQITAVVETVERIVNGRPV